MFEANWSSHAFFGRRSNNVVIGDFERATLFVILFCLSMIALLLGPLGTDRLFCLRIFLRFLVLVVFLVRLRCQH